MSDLYIDNKEVSKYEGNDYFIFFDRSMVQYGVWVFVDVNIGHMETFNNKNEAFDYLDAPIKKINSADVPMPYSSVLEKKYLPQVNDIVLAIKEVCYI